jgi:hypothetical protein
VQATDFAAKSEVGAVRLSWVTHSEIDNVGFAVLRSDSGTAQFTLVASYLTDQNLKGLGTSATGRKYQFVDKSVNPGTVYEYKVQSVFTDGVQQDLATVFARVGLPTTYALYQNYPNPFNPTTKIEFTLPADGRAVLKVYDITGREVATLVDEQMNAGEYQKTVFDASRFPSGVYFARLQFDGKQLLKKMLLVK